SSKIRDLLAQVNELYNDIVLEPGEKLNNDYVDRILHLKVKMIYDAGRDRETMARWEEKEYPNGKLAYFFNETGLLNMINEIGDSRKKFIDYCKYFEALVAYHKYFGGKE
ncbi:MAG: type III-A CRISPR-associated protein Csm2, partial [Christensenellaceae bacterium]|nr:type III-A CRISPR-associated protein Csm2 [Christensenellaceae bacterium]